MSPIRSSRLYVILLIVLPLLAFSQVTKNGFINFDDPTYVQNNPLLLGGLTGENVVKAFTTIHAGYWIPLTWVSYQIDYSLYGFHPWGYHLTNLLLHIAAVLLLYRILRAMTGSDGIGFFVAALFAIHPIQVESVAWVTERKDVLSTAFWMLTTWSYLRYVQQPGWQRYLLTTLFLTLGLMAKPMLVTLPCTLLLLDYWPLRRDRSFLQLVYEKLPFFLLALGAAVVTVLAQDKGTAVRTLAEFSIEARIENVIVSYVAYLGKLFWPFRLGIFYPHPGESLTGSQVAIAGAFLGLVTLVAIGQVRKRPYLLIGWLWYLGTLFPVSGIMQAGWQGMADRFAYVPSIGIFLMLTGALAEMASLPRWRPVIVGAGTLALLGCLVLTFRQIPHWKNSETIWRWTLQVAPSNFLSDAAMASALLDQGKAEEAMPHLQRAIADKPDHPLSHYLLGKAWLTQGKLEKAKLAWKQALELRPDSVRAYVSLADVHSQQKQWQQAERYALRAIALKPEGAEGHHILGAIRERQGRPEEAIGHYQVAVRLNPHVPTYREDLERLR